MSRTVQRRVCTVVCGCRRGDSTLAVRWYSLMFSWCLDSQFSVRLVLSFTLKIVGVAVWVAVQQGSIYGRRTNRVSLCSPCVWWGSSFSWLSITYSCVSWMCFGVATFLATCFFMVALVVSLLHGLAWALLHAAMNPYFFTPGCFAERNTP